MKKRRKANVSHQHSITAIHTVYQPIIEIKTGKLLGYEALTRGTGDWRSPEKLFDYSYEHGSTLKLDQACLKKAFQILPSLNRGELLFVNVEPVTWCSLFGRWNRLKLLLHGVPRREQIVFELTEGIKTRQVCLLKKGILFLQRFGCRFALDDIRGVGLKLFELLELKPHFVKLKGSLTRRFHRKSFHRWIVEVLVELSRKRKFEIVAEGVERSTDVMQVAGMGIRYAQGFYYARPHPLDALKIKLMPRRYPVP